MTRIESASEVSAASLRAMEGRLAGAAGLLPQHARFGAVGYGCTSAVALIGADREGVKARNNREQNPIFIWKSMNLSL